MRERYNIEPVVLVPRDGKFPEQCRKNKIKVICSQSVSWMFSNKLLSKIKIPAKILCNKFKFYPQILRLLKNEHFDLIHTNSSVFPTGDVIARHFKIPHIWHLREYGAYDYDLHYIFPKSFVRAAYARANAVIAISRSMYDSFVKERALCSESSTRIIYNGVKVPCSYEKKYVGERVNFCIVGGVTASKNQFMAVKSCAKIKNFADKFTLHIIGSGDKKYIDEMKAFIRSQNLEENVKFWGTRYDVCDILKNMDVGLMLSRREAFGRVTVEYMMNYMPVIGVNTGATPELITENESGYICDFDDVEKLSEIMKKFITNPALIKTMGESARKIAVEKFSLEKNTDEIYKLYCEVLV